MTRSPRSVSLCGQKLHGLKHVCAFFDSRDETYDILNPYFQEGLENGEEVITIVESAVHDEHMARMRNGGVDVEPAIERGQLKVLSSNQTYIKDSIFVAERMYEMLGDVLRAAKEGPYGAVRTFGDMEWALLNLPGTDELMMYEAKVNLMAPAFECTLLCAYDVNRFSGRVIADVLATHSHVVLGGYVHENPHFSDPTTFIQKMALRRPAISLCRGGAAA